MKEEKNLSCGIIHCISASIFLICSILLIIFSSIYGTAIDIVSLTIFAISVFIYYLFSTLYHLINIQTFFKKFDKITNYILITSTFIPLFLCILKGAWGWSLFGTICVISITSIIMTSIWNNMPKILHSILYFIINCTFIFSIIPLINTFTYLNLENISILFFISTLLYFIAELIDLLSYKTIVNKRFHTLSHILISIATLLDFIFYFIYIFTVIH